MKILMIVHGFAPECTGGTESYVLRLSQELTARGHRVEVLSGSHEGAGERNAEPRIIHTSHEGIPVHRLLRTGLFNDAWERSLAPEVEPLVDYVLRDFRPDLVHVHHWIRLTRNLIEICHDREIPAVCTLHDLAATCPKAFRLREEVFCTLEMGPKHCLGCAPRGRHMGEEEIRRELALYREDYDNELSLARRVIVPSSAHKDVLLEHLPFLAGRFRVVPHGNISPLSPMRPRPSEFPEGPLRVGHWGTLSVMKGYDILLKAIAGLSWKSDLELHVFGEVAHDHEQEKFEELARSLRIVRHGAFRPQDLVHVPLDLAVFPTRCSESWSFVLDEAFLLGLPAIVPNRGALAERIGDAGARFIPEDPRDLRRIFQEIKETPNLLVSWRARVPRLMGMPDHAQHIERVYQEVRSSHAPLSKTPNALRNRRLLARIHQMEARGHRLIDFESKSGTMESELARARETMEEMQYYHVEKDKELRRLSDEVDILNETLDSLRFQDAQHPSAADLVRELKALEKKDRKKQRRIDKLREELGELQATTERSREGERSGRDLIEVLGLIDASRRALLGQLEVAHHRLKAAESQLELSAGTLNERAAQQQEAHLVELEALERSLESERRAVRQALESLQEDWKRLRDLDEKSRALDAQGLSISSNLRTLVDEARSDATLEHLGEILEKRLGAIPEPPSNKEALADPTPTSLLGEIVHLEGELRHVLHHATMRHERLLESLARSQELNHELARTLDALLARVVATERRRQPSQVTKASIKKTPSGRLKILYVVHQFLPRHVAGTEVYTHRLAKEMAKRHDVVILTAESDHSRPRFEWTQRDVDGLRVHQIIHNYTWENFRDTYDCPEADSLFRRILTDEQPDVVHIQHLHYFSANFVTIARARGTAVIYTLHDYMLICPRDGQMRRADGELCLLPKPPKCADCIAHHTLSQAPAPPLPRAIHPGAEALVSDELTRVLRRARHGSYATPHEEAIGERLDYLQGILQDVDLFISPSRFLRDRFVDSGMLNADRIIVSNNGYDPTVLDHARPKPLPGHLRVGYIGTIAEHKGVHVLIEAMNGITDPAISCHIWGDLRAFVEYTQHLVDLIQSPRVYLMGPFPPSRLADVLRAFDVLVIPSLWWENSPLTVHEAAQAGLPVIATDQGGLAEYVRPGITGCHFRMNDAADLREKILAFAHGRNPLPNFDPTSLPIKTIAEDATDMEERYTRIVDHRRLKKTR